MEEIGGVSGLTVAIYHHFYQIFYQIFDVIVIINYIIKQNFY